MSTIRDIFTEKRYITFCRKITKGTDLADDLLQHCAIRIHEKGVCEDPRAKFTLFSYFKRTAINEWRHPASKFNQLYRRNPTLPINQQISRDTVEDEPTDFRRWLDRHLSRDTSYNEAKVRKAEAKAKESAARSLKIRDQLLKHETDQQAIQQIHESHAIRMERIKADLEKATKPEDDFFLNELFILYLQLGSTHKVSKETGIPQATVSKCINTYKIQVQDEYRKISDH